MSRNQIILLFLLSIIFGLGAVFFAKQWMDRQAQPQTKVEVVEREPVIVAAIEIAAGTVLDEQHFTTKQLEKAWRAENQFTDVSTLVGMVATDNMYPDEIVIAEHISAPGQGATLATLIPEDKRALTIRVNDVIGVAGFLLPGNRVDILSTVKYGQNSASTTTVLKDIKVLAVDQTARTKENKPIIVRAVTLEVTPKEAEKLLSANTKGAIQLALRNPQAIEPKVVQPYVAPRVTIIKGTNSSSVRVRE
ncbi:Flp pilus assembly protein CpaB [Vibrio diazotrophicus]|uniref:Flp pilus assembly protein CpaB n=2 Tax=Bacteria TaxID=2 RepID=UPI000C9DE216|nr:Flp pilus assembly protein CpaB [Vibrio diazotrophicus]PNH81634.1 Flp pilus assembly protein CpaB [Vibrio diazotrophicus]